MSWNRKNMDRRFQGFSLHLVTPKVNLRRLIWKAANSRLSGHVFLLYYPRLKMGFVLVPERPSPFSPKMDALKWLARTGIRTRHSSLRWTLPKSRSTLLRGIWRVGESSGASGVLGSGNDNFTLSIWG